MAETGSMEEYSHFFEVRLELFDGPIDLLLHLVKQKELPIEKLSLSQVTGQYLECVQRAKSLDLEVAGEYLVIAATLLSIKSSILLNEPVELVEDEEGNLIDPHEELLKRLREAEVYKQGAFFLSCRKMLGLDVFGAPPRLEGVEPPPVKYKDHDAILLGIAFKKVLDKAPKDLGITITFEAVSIVDRMMSIMDNLKREASEGNMAGLSFDKLVPDLTNRAVIVGSFVALLELCKRQAIKVKQSDCFQQILICLAEHAGEVEISSEFDAPASSDVSNG